MKQTNHSYVSSATCTTASSPNWVHHVGQWNLCVLVPRSMRQFVGSIDNSFGPSSAIFCLARACSCAQISQLDDYKKWMTKMEVDMLSERRMPNLHSLNVENHSLCQFVVYIWHIRTSVWPGLKSDLVWPRLTLQLYCAVEEECTIVMSLSCVFILCVYCVYNLWHCRTNIGPH